jgi:hypothetical protein
VAGVHLCRHKKREKLDDVQQTYICFRALRRFTRISLRLAHITFYPWAMSNRPSSSHRHEAVPATVEREARALRKPHRLWMTGSFAVVMAALSPTLDRMGSKRVLRQSPYDMNETLQRIEDAARHQGLSVLAEVDGSQPVIVLGSSIGGTPVVMDRADSRPDVPLSVRVRERVGGGIEVLVANAADDTDTDWQDLPTEVADDLAALPQWVDRALS